MQILFFHEHIYLIVNYLKYIIDSIFKKMVYKIKYNAGKYGLQKYSIHF
jgi:hypothetical protein